MVARGETRGPPAPVFPTLPASCTTASSSCSESSMAVPYSLPMLQRAMTAVHMDMDRGKWQRDDDDGGGGGTKSQCERDVLDHIYRVVIATLGPDTLAAWALCMQPFFEADSRATFRGESPMGTASREDLHQCSLGLRDFASRRMRSLRITALLPALARHHDEHAPPLGFMPIRDSEVSMPLRMDRSAVVDDRRAFPAELGERCIEHLAQDQLRQGLKLLSCPEDEAPLLGRQLQAAASGMRYALDWLRFEVLRVRMARLVAVHMATLKARLWRPDGALMQRKLVAFVVSAHEG